MSKIESIASKGYYLDFLDGAKGLAILMVILVHVSSIFAENNYLYSSSINLVTAGARGVQLLFMLSAFSLFHSNSEKIKSNSKMELRNFSLTFFKRRIYRLYPLWFVVNVIAIILSTNSIQISQILYSLTFLFGFIRFMPGTEIIIGGWAIFAEIAFYLVFPAIFKAVKNITDAFKLLLVSILISFGWRYLVPVISIPTNNSFWYLFPLFHFYSFGIGVFLYFIYKDFIPKISLSTKWLNLISAMSLPLLFTNNYDSSVISLSVILVIALFNNTIINRLTKIPMVKNIGKLIYPIFLLHFIIISITKETFISYQLSWSPFLSNELMIIIAFPIITFVTAMLALIIHNIIEIPVLRIGKT